MRDKAVAAGLSILMGLAGSLTIGTDARAKMAPDTAWETTATAHFRIHYPTSYGRFAAVLGTHLEDAYKILSKQLKWELAGRLDVVVRGDTDVPNGQATVFPFNRLVVNAVPFSPTSSIGEYDDWIRTLAFHELTHVVANDITRGVFKVARAVFGTVAKMNAYQPLWLIEGLAVYEETELGAYGRGRSAFVDMVVRTAARDGLLNSEDPRLGVTLDRLNDGVPEWPASLTPYVYGYAMNRIMAEKGGPVAPAKLQSAAGAYLPVFVNTVAKDALGTDHYDLWDRAVTRMKQVSDADLARIRRAPVTKARTLGKSGRLSRGVAVSGDGRRVFYIRDSYDEGLGLSFVERASGHEEVMTRWRREAGASLRWVPGSGAESAAGALLYSRVDPFKEFHEYSDVFLYDLEEDDEIRITRGARALDPDFSSDFEWDEDGITSGAVAYVKNLADGNQGLAVFDGAKEKILFAASGFERLGSPAWGRGEFEDWIVFSFKVNGGNERLMAVNAATRERRALTRHAGPALRVSEATPSWTAAGGLLYASTLGGVSNLYRVSPEQVRRALAGPEALAVASRVSNFETGAVFPVEAPGGALLAMVYGKRGYDVAEVEAAGMGEEPVALDSLHAKLGEKTEHADAGDYWVDWPGPSTEKPEPDAGGYSVFPAIWPKYWYPFFEKVPDGVMVGAATAGHDALELHHYTLTAAYDNRADFPVYSVLYQYDGFYPSIQLERRQDNQYIGLLKLSNRVESNILRFRYPMDLAFVEFGATVSSWKFFKQRTTSGGLQFRLGHADLLGAPDSIDLPRGDRGHRLDATLTGFFLGGTQFSTLEARAEQRVPMFFRQHFLRLNANVGLTFDESGQAPPFVGGGQESIVAEQSYLLRGYAPGAIYGPRIATANLEYWLSLKDLFRARGTLPAFYERGKLKLFADTGSATTVGGKRSNFSRWPVGVGAEILNDLTLAYHFKFTLGLGFHMGFDEALGGERQIVLGLLHRLL